MKPRIVAWNFTIDGRAGWNVWLPDGRVHSFFTWRSAVDYALAWWRK